MSEHLTDAIKTQRVMNAVAAGTTDQNSDGVDCTGFDCVRFTALFGVLTATQVTTMKLQASDDDGSADAWSDLEASQTAAMGDADDQDCLICDVFRPTKKWVRAVVERGTANAVIDGVVAELYRPRTKPVTKDARIISQIKLVTPAEGTA